MPDPFRLVADFNETILGLPAPEQPTRLSSHRKGRRINHYHEEIREYADAMTLEDEVDALVDLIYVAMGDLHERGVDGLQHFFEVHNCNMCRERGENARRPHTGEEPAYDAVKPEGWVGPDHAGVIRDILQARSMGHGVHDTTFLGRCPIPPPVDGEYETVSNPLYDELTFEAASGPLAYEDVAPEAGTVRAPDNGAPKLILVGHGRHGKDTAAEMLRDLYGYRFCASSLFCAGKVMLSAFAEYGIRYPDAEACFEDRHGSSPVGDHRTFWFDRIAAYCSPDKAKLARELFEAGNDIYVGVRDRRELWAAKLAVPGALIVWVDASNRLPPEQGSSMNVEPWMADLVLDNNGDLEQLEMGVRRLAEALHS